MRAQLNYFRKPPFSSYRFIVKKEARTHQKRKVTGTKFYLLAALIFVLYLSALTGYMLCVEKLYMGIDVSHVFESICNWSSIVIWDTVIASLSGVSLLIEVYQMYTEGWDYIDTSNVVELLTSGTALLASVCPYLKLSYSFQLSVLVVSVLLGYVTLLLYFQSLFQSGIYVTMLFEVLKSLVKVTGVFIMLLFAYALAFQLLLSRRLNDRNWNSTSDENTKDPFDSLDSSFMKVMVMMIGEIEYTRFFNDQDLFLPFVSHAVFISFCVMMPIVLMNLTIGLAVGDIESIQKNAELKRLSLTIETVFEFEEKLPSWLLKRLYSNTVEIKTNACRTSRNFIWGKIKGLSSKLMSFNADADTENKRSLEDAERDVVEKISRMFAKKMDVHEQRMEKLHKEMGDQHEMLVKILTFVKKREQRPWLEVGELVSDGSEPAQYHGANEDQ